MRKKNLLFKSIHFLLLRPLSRIRSKVVRIRNTDCLDTMLFLAGLFFCLDTMLPVAGLFFCLDTMLPVAGLHTARLCEHPLCGHLCLECAA